MRLHCALLLSGALAAALPLAAQTAPQAPSGQSSQHSHRALPRPANLQVLPRDISTQDLIATMRGYAKALGVECEYCHAENAQTHIDFASDAKPDKGIARTMIKMTGEINAKYLSTVNDPDATPADKTVNCGTCHRGQEMPVPFNDASSGHHSMPMQPKPE